MDNIAGIVLTLLIIVAAGLVLAQVVSTLGEEAASREPSVVPVIIEEVKRGYLVVRNIGTEPAYVDALYVYAPWGDRLIATYKYPQPYELQPGEVREIPIPSSLWGAAPYASPVRYELGGGNSGISALRGPFLPLGGLILGVFVPGSGNSFQPLTAGLGSIYVAEMVNDPTDPQTLLLGISYYDLESKKLVNIAVPHKLNLLGISNGDMTYLFASITKLRENQLLVAGPSVDPNALSTFVIIDPKHGEVKSLGIPPAASTAGQTVQFDTLSSMSVASLYYSKESGRVYFTGYANVTFPNQPASQPARASVVGYLDLNTGQFKLKAFWTPAGTPWLASDLLSTRTPAFLYFKLSTPQIVEAGGRVFVKASVQEGGLYTDVIAVLDKDLNQVTHLMTFDNTVVTPMFSTLKAHGDIVYYAGLGYYGPAGGGLIGGGVVSFLSRAFLPRHL